MKEHVYESLAVLAWGGFFATIYADWPFPWGFIGFFVGFPALLCTLALRKPGSWSKQWPSTTGAWEWLAQLCIVGCLVAIKVYLPPSWQQLFLLLAIVAIYCISRVWPDRKVEEKSEDALAEKNINQGV